MLPVVFSVNRAPTKPVQDMAKYLVYEDCLLELFKICPTCSRLCKVHTFVKGTSLSVTQTCLHQSCLYARQWNGVNLFWAALQLGTFSYQPLSSTLALLLSRLTRFVKKT